MHYPEKWRYLFFTDEEGRQTFSYPNDMYIRQALFSLYYQQKGESGEQIKQTELDDKYIIENILYHCKLNQYGPRFIITLTHDRTHESWIIDETGLIKKNISKTR